MTDDVDILILRAAAVILRARAAIGRGAEGPSGYVARCAQYAGEELEYYLRRVAELEAEEVAA